jgi:hypothetical protein
MGAQMAETIFKVMLTYTFPETRNAINLHTQEDKQIPSRKERKKEGSHTQIHNKTNVP